MLGLGEAGERLAADLASGGVLVRGFDPRDVPTPDHVERAGDAGAAVAGATVVLVLTTASSARAAAESARAGLGPDMLYADLNTAPPALKQELDELVAPTGARFVDVALLGPVPERGLRAPVLASGAGAVAFADLFGPLGMPVEVVSEVSGDAAAMKLVRSVFMKGLAAAIVESMQAADAIGRRDWLAQEIETMIGRPYLERALDGSRTHAVRRVDEMAAARDLLLELGVAPHVAAACAAQLEELAAAGGR